MNIDKIQTKLYKKLINKNLGSTIINNNDGQHSSSLIFNNNNVASSNGNVIINNNNGPSDFYFVQPIIFNDGNTKTLIGKNIVRNGRIISTSINPKFLFEFNNFNNNINFIYIYFKLDQIFLLNFNSNCNNNMF